MFRDYLRAYGFHGVHAFQTTRKDAMGNCRFCGDRGHFSINVMTGVFRCLKCEKKGNLYTFLNELWLMLLQKDSREAGYRKLSADRGISAKVLRNGGLVWDDELDRWLMPTTKLTDFIIVGEGCGHGKETVVNLKAWVPFEGKMKLLGTPTCKNHPKGMPSVLMRLAMEGTKLDKSYPEPRLGINLYVCEGEWDYLAFLDNEPGNRLVIGVPGAGYDILKYLEDVKTTPLGELLKISTLTLLYDNDVAGRKGVASILQKNPPFSVRTLYWPDDTPSKYDIRDLVNSGKTPEEVWEFIERNCS